jgi:hypothetical protein
MRQAVVNYSGHGSVDIWKDGLFRSSDSTSMTNTNKLSLFMLMTCLNGYFMDPKLDSLAESLLKANQSGAIAVWASSEMTLQRQDGCGRP